MNYKIKVVLAIIGLIINFLILFTLLNIINDLKITANGYKSDRDICRQDHKELIKNYYELEKECCK